MRFCLKYNATLVDYRIPDNPYFTFDEQTKRFKGKYLDAILSTFYLKKRHETQKQLFRFCKFVITVKEGRLLPNSSTYTGALGMLQRHEADLKTRLTFDKSGDDFLLTKVCSDAAMYVSHFIDPPKEENDSELLQPVIDIVPGFMAELLVSLAFFYAFSSGLYLIARQRRTIRYPFGFFFANLLKLRQQLLSGGSARLGFFNFLFVFSVLFFFFLQNLIGGGIQTSKVVVDDSQILNSEEKLINSKLNACFFDETHIDLYKHHTNMRSSLIWHVYNRKMDPANMCFVVGNKNFEKFNQRMFILPSLFSFTLRFLASFRQQDMFSDVQHPWLASNLGFYLSKRVHRALRKAIDDLWTVPLLEQGHLMRMFDLCAFQMDNDFPIKSTIFTSTKEFKDAHTFADDQSFDKFKAFFYLHILLLSLFSLVQTAALKWPVVVGYFRA